MTDDAKARAVIIDEMLWLAVVTGDEWVTGDDRERWGVTEITVSREQLQAVLGGQTLALDCRQEYIVLVRVEGCETPDFRPQLSVSRKI